MVLFMKSSWTFQGTQLKNSSRILQDTVYMNSLWTVPEHKMVLFMTSSCTRCVWNVHEKFMTQSSWTIQEWFLNMRKYFIYHQCSFIYSLNISLRGTYLGKYLRHFLVSDLNLTVCSSLLSQLLKCLILILKGVHQTILLPGTLMWNLLWT